MWVSFLSFCLSSFFIYELPLKRWTKFTLSYFLSHHEITIVASSSSSIHVDDIGPGPALDSPIHSFSLYQGSYAAITTQLSTKGIFKVPPGCFFGRAGHQSDQIFHASGGKLWQYTAELRTLSVTYSLCVLDLTITTDNLSEICLLKLRLLPIFCTIKLS